jgi:hypothetical protein
MKVLLNKDQVVVDKSNEVKVVSNGILINNVIYGEQGLTVIDTNLNPRILKDKIVDGKIIPNGEYKAPEHEHLKEFVVQKIITKEQYKQMTKLDYVPPVVEESVEAK